MRKFESLSSFDGALDERRELHAAAVAEVEVEPVVGEGDAEQMLGVDGAAEELERVVLVVQDLDVVDDRAVADAAERQAVDLLVRGDLEAAELQAHVAQRCRCESAGSVPPYVYARLAGQSLEERPCRR